jgi:5-methylcytosine-specific restriction protein A
MTTQEIQQLIAAGRIRLFYKRKAWRRKRREILRRDNHECQRCKARGRYSKATVVHHIQHLDRRPGLAYTDSNLTSLCDPCHNLEHPEKMKGFDVVRREALTPERW